MSNLVRIEEGRRYRREAIPGNRVPWSEQTFTLLMCDLVDSTPLSEVLTSVEQRELLMSYYSDCSRLVERSQGRIVRYIGDGVLAMFKDPSTTDGALICAIQAAMKIRDCVRTIRIPRAVRAPGSLAVRIAVVLGTGITDTVACSDGCDQEVIFGQLPFLAERLKCCAEPDGIVVNREAAAFARSCFSLEPFGGVALKGFTKTVPVWGVIS